MLVSELGKVQTVTLAAPPRSCVSRVQILLWATGRQLLVGVPLSSQRVLIQPWGHPARSTPLARLPVGEPLGSLTTLWLPWSDAARGHKGGRWRIAVAGAFADRHASAGARWDTYEPKRLAPLTAEQLDAVLHRFGEFLHFPARTPAPAPRPYRKMPAHQRKAVEHRLAGVSEAVREAHGLARLGSDAQLLHALLEAGALDLADGIVCADDLRIVTSGQAAVEGSRGRPSQGGAEPGRRGGAAA